MSVQSNITTDTINLSIVYNYDYTIGITGAIDGVSALHGLSGSDLAPKGYVDYVFDNRRIPGITGLYYEIMGITGGVILDNISKQYDTIKEISDKLLVFGDTGTTGTTIYNILSIYSQENTWRKNDLAGFTGSVFNAKNRALDSEATISGLISTETSNFTNEIKTEESKRKSADAGLTGMLSTEKNNFYNDISILSTSRQSADAGLTGMLSTEKNNFYNDISILSTDRQSADAGLTGMLSTEKNNFYNDISILSTDRQSADSGLTGRIEGYKSLNDAKLAYMSFSGQTGATGNYLFTKDIALNPNGNSNSPYYFQLSDKFRITPSNDLSALRFQYYKNLGANNYSWIDIVKLNKF